ncbi:hypothetical protein GCM10010495_43980 [Kitasatospora herbaricolor]|nr:hypothetical protein GCM10010495_43980 [Kitasatospora herbaricolor]
MCRATGRPALAAGGAGEANSGRTGRVCRPAPVDRSGAQDRYQRECGPLRKGLPGRVLASRDTWTVGRTGVART